MKNQGDESVRGAARSPEECFLHDERCEAGDEPDPQSGIWYLVFSIWIWFWYLVFGMWYLILVLVLVIGIGEAGDEPNPQSGNKALKKVR